MSELIKKHKDKSRVIVLEPFEVPSVNSYLDISLVPHSTRFSSLVSSCTQLVTTCLVIFVNYFIYRSRRHV